MTRQFYTLIYKSKFDGEVVEMPFADKPSAEVARDELFEHEQIIATIIKEKDDENRTTKSD